MKNLTRNAWISTALRTAILLLTTFPGLGVQASPSPSRTPAVSRTYVAAEARGEDGERAVNPLTNSNYPLAAAVHPERLPDSQSRENVSLLKHVCLILFMVIPGLAIFYGSLLQGQSVLRLFWQSLGAALMVSVLWCAFGYSFVFADGSRPIFGSVTRFAFLRGVNSVPNSHYFFAGSQNVFCVYQLMFAIVASAIILDTIGGRVKFSALLAFIGFWMVFVYFPLAHMLWGIDGIMNGILNPRALIRAIDFGGGTVIQMAAGWSGLILFLILGKPQNTEPATLGNRRIIMCLMGQAMLCLGWYGFDSGAAVSTQMIANAFVNLTLAIFAAAFAWMMADYASSGEPGVLPFCSGAIAGLAAITPASGFVNPTGAIIIGLSAGLIPAITRCSRFLRPLEIFAVHALGGTIGVFLTGVLATNESNHAITTGIASPAKFNGLASLINGGGLWFEQSKAIFCTLALACVVSTILGYALKVILRFRVSHPSI